MGLGGSGESDRSAAVIDEHEEHGAQDEYDEFDTFDEYDEDTTLVVAQGTFDIVHPGHVHYLEESAAMGDALVVIVSRRSNVDHKAPPVCPASQRRAVVDAFGVVDRAILGHESDIFVPIERLDPDVIALGHDQHHDDAAIATELDRRGIDCEIRRTSACEPAGEELYSSRAIARRIIERNGRAENDGG